MKKLLINLSLLTLILCSVESRAQVNLSTYSNIGITQFQYRYDQSTEDLLALIVGQGLRTTKNNFGLSIDFARITYSNVENNSFIQLELNNDLSNFIYNQPWFQETTNMKYSIISLCLEYDLILKKNWIFRPSVGASFITGNTSRTTLSTPGGEPTTVGYSKHQRNEVTRFFSGYILRKVSEKVNIGMRYRRDRLDDYDSILVTCEFKIN